MSFRVGQKVVCIDAAQFPGFRWHPDADIPRVGEVYTVTGIFQKDGKPGVVLKEIKNVEEVYSGYRASRFRPAVDRKTDISVFTKILNREVANA
jgi:hypothetical protein